MLARFQHEWLTVAESGRMLAEVGQDLANSDTTLVDVRYCVAKIHKDRAKFDQS